MNAAAQEIHDEEQAVTQQLVTQLTTSPLPWPPLITDPQPAYWTVYNRWTGKYVSDVLGNENADVTAAHRWPTRAAAALFVCTSRNTAVATARCQAPPDDPPSCENCWRPQERDAVSCPHCHATLSVPSGWIHVFPHAADGSNRVGSLTL